VVFVVLSHFYYYYYFKILEIIKTDNIKYKYENEISRNLHTPEEKEIKKKKKKFTLLKQGKEKKRKESLVTWIRYVEGIASLGRQDSNMIQAGFTIKLVALLQMQVFLILHSSVCRCIGFTVDQLRCWADNRF
jgi:hypothetical protein